MVDNVIVLTMLQNSLLTKKAKAKRVLAEKEATIAALKQGVGRGGFNDATRVGGGEDHFE